MSVFVHGRKNWGVEIPSEMMTKMVQKMVQSEFSTIF